MSYILIVCLVVVVVVLWKRVSCLKEKVTSNKFYLNILEDAIDELYSEVFPDDCDECVAPVKGIVKKKK